MPESIKLTIIWDGSVPGLSDHRISLGEFGEPLGCLVKALRRIANNAVSEALGKYPAKTGRLPEGARQLDIELISVVPGSGGFEGLITVNTPMGDTIPLFDVAEWSAVELLESIDQERRGNLRNEQVRNYFKSLPAGLTSQKYILTKNDSEIRRIEFANVDLAAEVLGLPFLIEIVGRVTGVGFDPGRNQIRFQIDDAQDMTVGASAEQVDFALENRADPIRALILIQSETKKLLKIGLNTEHERTLDTETFIFKRWDELLQRLAH